MRTHIPSSLQDYLLTRHIGFQVISGSGMESVIQLARSHNIPLNAITKVIMLRDHQGFVMAVCPVNCYLDLGQVKALTGRKLEIAAQAEYVNLFRGLDLNALPPLAQAYGLEMVVDERLQAHPSVYLETGTQLNLLKLSGADFLQLCFGAQWGDIAEPMGKVVANVSFSAPAVSDPYSYPPSTESYMESPLPGDELFDDLLSSLSLPLLLKDIISLQQAGNLSQDKLVDLVSGDPEVAALLVQFAQVSLFAHPPRTPTLRHAIAALGEQLSAGLASGLVLIRRYSMPLGGALGQLAFWRQAIYCCATLHLLAKKRGQKPQWTLYLGGLLHNFGFLLLSYLDPHRFAVINEVLTRMPERNVHEIEAMMLGENHCRLGARLMQLWDLPDEVIVAVCEHHNEEYRGEHSDLANLILVSNRLLKRYGIGDARRVLIDDVVLAQIGLDMGVLDGLIEEVLDHCRQLDNLANQLVISSAH